MKLVKIASLCSCFSAAMFGSTLGVTIIVLAVAIGGIEWMLKNHQPLFSADEIAAIATAARSCPTKNVRMPSI